MESTLNRWLEFALKFIFEKQSYCLLSYGKYIHRDNLWLESISEMS